MKSVRSLSFFMLVSSMALSACGTGNDPLAQIDSSQSDIEMALPFTATAQTLNGYSAAGTSWSWILPTTTSTYSVLAPVGGLVVEVDSVTGASEVKIRVNSTYQVTVHSMLTLSNVREGDEVSRGDTLGTTSSMVGLILERDGKVICPYPHFTTEAMDAINLLARNLLVTVCDQ